MRPLLKNVRFYVLAFSIIFSLALYFLVFSSISFEQTRIIRLQQLYALTSVVYLYIAMLASPLYFVFKKLPGKVTYIKARRAIGVAAFYFAFLHSYLTFFDQLGGVQGLGFLSANYLQAVVLGGSALLILFLMTVTSSDWVISKLTFTKWKFLHRFVYLAGILILVHALMQGSHFQNLSDTIPTVLFVAVAFLLILETVRFVDYLQKKDAQR